MSNNSSQERIAQKLSPNSEGKKRGKVIAVTAVIFVVLILVVALILILFKPKSDISGNNAVVTPDNVDEILAQMQDKQVAKGTYDVVMNTTWEFEKGDSASTDAYVENATDNTNDVYFDIVRSDTGDTIFTSPTIPVGSHLENITLDTPLEAGTHACVLTYHLLDESGNSTSKLNINLTIIVNN